MKKLLFVLALTGITIAQVHAQTHKTGAKKPAASTSIAASIAAGQKIYIATCLTCHQADGGGVSNMNPPLIKTTYVLGDKNKIIQIVLKGFSEKVEINGDEYSNVMPAQSTLTDQQVADVLTYVRNSFGNKASAVKAADVKKVRATLK